MKTKLILLIFFLINFFIVQKTTSQEKNENYFSDPTWNLLSIQALSPDGLWAVVGKKFNNNPQPNKVFFINTQTKEKRDYTHFSSFYNSLLNNGLVVGKIKKDIAIYSLNQKDSLLVEDVTKFSVSTKLDLLHTLTNNDVLIITKLNERLDQNKVIHSLQGVDKYYVNPSSDKIIVLKKSKELLYIDSKRNSVKKLLTINDSIDSITWNKSEDVFTIYTKNKSIQLVDLNTYKVKNIDLDNNIENLQISFFLNNDIYISYQMQSDQTMPESEYVDIWQANSRLLSPSDFKIKYKIIYKAFVYHNNKDKLQELDRKIDADYLNLGIPGYLISYNYFKNHDFSSIFPLIEYSLFDLDKNKVATRLTLAGQNPFQGSLDGKYILYPYNTGWQIMNTATLEKKHITNDSFDNRITPLWTSDSKGVLYYKNNNLYIYNVLNNSSKQYTDINEEQIIKTIINKKTGPYNKAYIDLKLPLYFTAIDTLDQNRNYLYCQDKGKTNLIYQTKNLLKFDNTISNKSNTFLFTIENYNLPPTVLKSENNTITTLIKPDIPENLYNWRKKIQINFSDKHNKQLKGYLTYPKDFDTKKTYPMVVYIYDQSITNLSKEFLIPELVTSKVGFNEALLAQQGYFVLFAQTYVTDEGPGVSAVDCVTNAVNKAIMIEPTIDKAKLGLMGQSFGGYKTSAVSTLSNLFKASIATAGAHDLIGGTMFSYNYYRRMPNWFMLENSQYKFSEKFSENPEKHYINSPLLNAYKTNTAMLLVAGLEDKNVDWRNTQKMFIALKREKKQVIALFYNKIGHIMDQSNPKESVDLAQRSLDWFDYHLKEKKNIPWIKNGLDYNEYSISPL